MKLERGETLLLVIDLQERLMRAMPEAEGRELVRQVGILIEGAKLLSLPIIATEQYPKGLGQTVPELRARLPEAPIEKLEFSACAKEEAKRAIAASGRGSVLVCGVEAHVCVYQTARDLLGEGFSVFIPEDAVLSRRESNRRVGLRLAEQAGAILTSTETALFELVGSAADPSFKELSRLLR